MHAIIALLLVGAALLCGQQKMLTSNKQQHLACRGRDVALDVAQGLLYLASKRILHGDIKVDSCNANSLLRGMLPVYTIVLPRPVCAYLSDQMYHLVWSAERQCAVEPRRHC